MNRKELVESLKKNFPELIEHVVEQQAYVYSLRKQRYNQIEFDLCRFLEMKFTRFRSNYVNLYQYIMNNKEPLKVRILIERI